MSRWLKTGDCIKTVDAVFFKPPPPAQLRVKPEEWNVEEDNLVSGKNASARGAAFYLIFVRYSSNNNDTNKVKT